MITRSSIAFEDFLGSSIAPQVMPPCCNTSNKIIFPSCRTVALSSASGMLQIQRLSQELPICGNIPFFVNLCSSLWIVSLLLVFGFEMTHSQLFLFSFKNHKSFAGFNVNVWGQDFFPLLPFKNRAFGLKSPQKVSITLHAMLKIFEQVDHEWHFQAGGKAIGFHSTAKYSLTWRPV